MGILAPIQHLVLATLYVTVKSVQPTRMRPMVVEMTMRGEISQSMAFPSRLRISASYFPNAYGHLSSRHEHGVRLSDFDLRLF